MKNNARIAVLGAAGMMGQGIIRDLLSGRSIIAIAEVRLFDTHCAQMMALREQLDDSRLIMHDLDIADPASLARVLAETDICAVPTLAG